jgi:hypothetical protein
MRSRLVSCGDRASGKLILMARTKLRLIVALLVGIASEFRPLPGLLGASLVFPQGVEGDHGIAYLVLAECLNFGMVFAATYYIVGLFRKPRIKTETLPLAFPSLDFTSPTPR